MITTQCPECKFEFHTTAKSLKCPQCKTLMGDPPKIRPPQLQKPKDKYPIRNHWFALHEYPYNNRDCWDKKEAIAWFNQWKSDIDVGCGCGEDFENITKRIQPVFRSAKEFAFQAYQWHDAVSKSPNVSNPQIQWKDYLASWWNEVIPTKPNLLITVATGKCLRELQITRHSLEDYANKINADLICIVNARENWWGLEKFRIQQFVPKYERTIFVDCDLVIAPDCPNLLDIVPKDKVGLHDDWDHLPHKEWMIREKQDVAKSQGWESKALKTCYNTGVVVMSRHHTIFSPPENPLATQYHCSEQFYVEEKIYEDKVPVHTLPTEYNTQWWMGDYAKRQKGSAYIIHAANAAEKIRELKRIVNEVYSGSHHS